MHSIKNLLDLNVLSQGQFLKKAIIITLEVFNIKKLRFATYKNYT